MSIESFEWEPPDPPHDHEQMVAQITARQARIRAMKATRKKEKLYKRLLADADKAASDSENYAALLRQRQTFLETWEPLIKHTQEVSAMDREAFFKTAMEPTMLSDDLDIIMRREDDKSFSVEAFESVGYQTHDFVLARTLAQWRRTGRPPTGMRVALQITWDDTPTDAELGRDNVAPWYSMDVNGDDTGATPLTLDGVHRMAAFLEARRKENTDGNQ